MCGSYTDVEQRKLFVLDGPACARCEIGSLLHDKDMHGSLFGEVVFMPICGWPRHRPLVSQLRFVHYDEVPRLRIAGRGAATGGFEYAVFFRVRPDVRDRTGGHFARWLIIS